MDTDNLAAIERVLRRGVAPAGHTIELAYELDDDMHTGCFVVWIPGYWDTRITAETLSGALDWFGQLCRKHGE